MQESLRQLRRAKSDRRKAAQTKAITFVTGVGLVAGGAGLTATGVGGSCQITLIPPRTLILWHPNFNPVITTCSQRPL